jgi:cation:H+ antiporter
MLLSVTAVIVGIVALVWSADRFVLGASGTAENLGVSPLIIGLVIAGFATSSPEMLVASIAAWGGNPGLGVGNAVGSNIANIGLILGASAIAVPLVSQSRILGREIPLLLIVTAVTIGLLLDRWLGRLEGLVLLAALVGGLAWMLRQALRQRHADDDALAAELVEHVPREVPLARSLTWLLVGFVVLLLSSRSLVWGGVNIAEAMGVSDLVIGLTIVAVGTSLPELAAAVASGLKGEPDLVLGNVIGSNFFNTLAVLGLPAIIRPGLVPADVLTRDLPVMAAMTLLLLPLLAHRRNQLGRISRPEGALLLTCFLGYQGYLLTTLSP